MAFWANKHAYNTHSSVNKQIHARKRRVLSHAFADGAIKGMEKYIIENVRTFCRVMHPANEAEKATELWGAPKNMADRADWLTFDIMGDLAFGKAFAMTERDTNRFAVDLISKAAHRHLIVSIFSFHTR